MSDLLQEGLGEGVFMCPGRNGPSLAFVPQEQGQRGCGWRTVSRISSLENTHKHPPVKNSTFVQEANKSLSLGMSIKKDVQLESCFIGGKMRIAAKEAVSQITLGDCSKEVVGRGQYIRFW